MTDRQLTRREIRDLERAREMAATAESEAAAALANLLNSQSIPVFNPPPVGSSIPAAPTPAAPIAETPIAGNPAVVLPVSQAPVVQAPVAQQAPTLPNGVAGGFEIPPLAPHQPPIDAPVVKTTGRRAAAPPPAAPAPLTADSVPSLLSGSISLPVSPAATPAVTPSAASDLFPRSGPIDVVPDTNSLVIEMPKDITNSTMVIADGGVTLTTGSITLPKLDTGEISLVVAAEAADLAVQEDKRDQIVTGIEPLPARRHSRSRKRQSVFPTKLRRGMGQVYIVLFSAILTASVLGLAVIAYMLGYIKF